MKIYVYKNALWAGVFEWDDSEFYSDTEYGKGEYCSTREEANKIAKNMIREEIARLNKEIKRLKDIEFV